MQMSFGASVRDGESGSALVGKAGKTRNIVTGSDHQTKSLTNAEADVLGTDRDIQRRMTANSINKRAVAQ